MKTIKVILIVFLMVLHHSGHTNGVGKMPDDGAVYCLGNGKMCIYEKGPDIITAYLGLYSSPAFLTTTWIKNLNDSSVAHRKQGTNFWENYFYSGNIESGKILDFVDSQLPCFVRNIQTKNRIIFRVKLDKYVQVIDNSLKIKSNENVSGRLLVVPSGTKIYQTYTSQRIIYSQIVTSGNAKIQTNIETSSLDIIFEPGESFLYIIGGPEYPDLMNNTMQIMKLPYETLVNRTTKYWNDFTAKRKDFTTLLPANTPQRAKLLQVIDDVAILLKSQQSSQGAEIAGYPYPLGYVRDQYGTSRGMLALGMFDEAKSILTFYWQIWKKYGYIHNGQAIGIDDVFHIHENDEVEITGYLILQAFDLLKATHDSIFMKEISPMLDWAFNCQKKNVVNGMLPFNGDETYVAGGMLPRSVLNDGSAEATMLFAESGQKYLDWVTENHYWSKELIAENRALLEMIKTKFQDNFWHDGILWTNNPERAKVAELPQYRHGVCEKMGANCLMNKYGGIVWTEKNENNRYVCAACISEETLSKAEPKVYNLLSAALSPFYMNFNTITYNQLQKTVIEIRDNFINTGAMTSKEEMKNQRNEIHTVGYDYGFLLTALTRLNMKEASIVYDKTLSIADRTGSWSEYYINDKPSGTRCRPWESAINLEALINWAVRDKE